MRTALLSLLLAGIASGCATNPVTGRQDIVLMSERDEIALGEQVNRQILKEERVYQNAELQAYVQQVGGRVAARSHRPGLEYTFTVLDNKDVNAFALPGGHIYVTRGLLAYLNSEAELAAVLGHEIGHVTARHAVRQHSASQLTSIGAAIGSAFIPGLGQAGYQLAGVLGTALLRGYGREHELEADRLGAEYLARSGYQPEAMIEVIRVLKNQEVMEQRLAETEGREARVYHGLFSTHPDNDTRLHEVVGAAGRLTQVEQPVTARNEYLQRIDGLVFGPGAGQGVVRGRDFLHGPLGFTLRFPDGWNVNNLSDRLVAVAPGNAAFLQLSLTRVAAGVTPREFIRSNMGITQLGNEQALRINGLPAHTGSAMLNTAEGPRLARVTVVRLGANIFVLAGLTPAAESFPRYDAAFVESARSFRQLDAAEREQASREQRIRTFLANERTSFENLAQHSPLQKFPVEQLRLLNGRFPKGAIRAGELLKTVQ